MGLYTHTHTHVLGSCRGGVHVCLHKVSTHLPSQMGQLPDSHGMLRTKCLRDKVSPY